MAGDELLKPTLHVEVLLEEDDDVTSQRLKEIGSEVAQRLRENYEIVRVGEEVTGFDKLSHDVHLRRVEVAAYTGQETSTGFYSLSKVELDVQAYVLTKDEPTLDTSHTDENDIRILALPHADLHEAWNSLVFDDGLPGRLLRYLVRMTGMMRQPGLNLAIFNWNRLCLLHGPPGSGKSTLCRALAQKISIRLGDMFSKSTLVEIDTNNLLSKYFGESGKLIGATFDRIAVMARERACLVCVVMDEIETIASSREKSTKGMECADGLRATNQLLTALDRLRTLPNVIVLCTSNLIEAIDPAFLDRVDMKQFVPSPSPAAIYNIFRSCLNELLRSSIVDANAAQTITPAQPSPPPQRPTKRSRKTKATPPEPPSQEPGTVVSAPTLPTFSEMKLRLTTQPNSPGSRVWALTQKCEGFSGRRLRQLPISGLAMYTGVGTCSLHDAVSALEAAVNQELIAMKGK